MEKYFESIIIPVDFGAKTSLIVKQASIFGQLMNCDIVLMYVENRDTQQVIKSGQTEIEEKLKELASKSQEKYGLNFYPVLLTGSITESILNFAKENYAKLIIMVSTGDIIKMDYYIGDNISKIIREAECPVLTINNEIISNVNKILLPLDVSKPIDQKLRWSTYFSRFFGSIIKVIYIAEDEKEIKTKKIEDKILEVKNFFIEYNIFCTTEILTLIDFSYPVSKMVVNYAKENDCDLIMIMTHEEDKTRGKIVGRTASNIITLSEKPVISITPHIKSEMCRNV